MLTDSLEEVWGERYCSYLFCPVSVCHKPFTKAVIHIVPAVVSSLRVVAVLQRLFSFPANSELVN